MEQGHSPGKRIEISVFEFFVIFCGYLIPESWDREKNRHPAEVPAGCRKY